MMNFWLTEEAYDFDGFWIRMSFGRIPFLLEKILESSSLIFPSQFPFQVLT